MGLGAGGGSGFRILDSPPGPAKTLSADERTAAICADLGKAAAACRVTGQTARVLGKFTWQGANQLSRFGSSV
jgi:hypothetical protein